MKAQSRYVAGAPRLLTNRKSGTPKKLSARASARDALKYMQYREKGEHEGRESRDLFTSEQDSISRADALELLMKNTLPRVAFQQVVLPWDNAEQVDNPREAIRAIMAAWDEAHGYTSQWTAVIHRNTDHLHAHVLIAGKAQDSTTGKSRLVTINNEKGDYELLNQLGREQSQYKEREQEHAILEQVERETQEKREQHAAELAQQTPQEQPSHAEASPQPLHTRTLLGSLPHLPAARAAAPIQRAASSAALFHTPTAAPVQEPTRYTPHHAPQRVRSRERSL
jgi:hypothetical protein